jgi:hypothetical protein
MRRPLAVLVCLVVSAAALAQGAAFRVTLDPGARSEPARGRLIVLLVKTDSKVGARSPIDGPFWEEPQPLFGIDVRGLGPGGTVRLGDEPRADASERAAPAPASQLPPGTYRAQARLDTVRLDSEWKRQAGNLYSDAVTFTVPVRAGASAPAAGPVVVDLWLTHATQAQDPEPAPGLEYVAVRSALLSEFHHREVIMRAGVVLPLDYDAAGSRAYAAVYEVPGFGGDHADARRTAASRQRLARGSPAYDLASNTFWIVLDPESENGHHLFADSANNGPRAEALVEELIPALEQKYRLAGRPAARLLRGHSSGGWCTLWLALTHPETFGACWSTSPDPVTFRRMQLVNIYNEASMYGHAAGEPTPADFPSYRRAGSPLMTIRQENQAEEVIGPDNTSAQQWDSWFAVFGPRNERGHPAALFDPATGAINHAVAEQYKKYDVLELLVSDPARYAIHFKQRIRLYVGDQDSFYLNEAVALLKPEVEKTSFLALPEGAHGAIAVLAGYDHGSIMMSPELRAIPADMLEHLRRHGLVSAPEPVPSTNGDRPDR